MNRKVDASSDGLKPEVKKQVDALLLNLQKMKESKDPRTIREWIEYEREVDERDKLEHDRIFESTSSSLRYLNDHINWEAFDKLEQNGIESTLESILLNVSGPSRYTAVTLNLIEVILRKHLSTWQAEAEKARAHIKHVGRKNKTEDYWSGVSEGLHIAIKTLKAELDQPSNK